MRADGSDRQRVDPAGWSGQWSPDGRMIAYIKLVDHRYNLVVFDLVEDEFFEVFDGSRNQLGQLCENFCWSPDGQQIAFKSQGRTLTADNSDSAATAWIMRTDVPAHRPAVPLFRSRHYFDGDLAWNVYSGKIVFATQGTLADSQRLHYLMTDSEQKPVSLAGQFPDRRNGSMSWTPDGRTLLYFSRPIQK